MSYLEEEIDFELLQDMGVIDQHYPLHDTEHPAILVESLQSNRLRLTASLCCCFSRRWKRHIQPIHLLRRYNGEAFAFYYIYVLHYLTLLAFPAILGLLLFIYQMWWFSQTGKMDLALDSVYNGLFGILVSIWATVFVESWKHKQQTLIHLWDLDSIQEILKNDEMKKYKYVNSYCTETHTKQKRPISQDHRILKVWNALYMLFATGISVVLMIYFEELTYDEITSFTSDAVLGQI